MGTDVRALRLLGPALIVAGVAALAFGFLGNHRAMEQFCSQSIQALLDKRFQFNPFTRPFMDKPIKRLVKEQPNSIRQGSRIECLLLNHARPSQYSQRVHWRRFDHSANRSQGHLQVFQSVAIKFNPIFCFACNLAAEGGFTLSPAE